MCMKTKSGRAVHPIGIGIWGIGSTIDPDLAHNKYKGVEPVYGNEVNEINAIRYSMYHGQNHIDCAELYGGFYTDEIVGRAIEGYSREDLYIADKLWRTSLAPADVRPTVQKMLKKLKTDYLDMLYIHAPFHIGWQAAVSEIDKLMDEGIVRQLGVSNFTVDDMKEMMKLSRYPITANQMNYNVLHQKEVDQEFLDFCRQHKVQLVAYQPIKRNEVHQNKMIQKIAHEHKATAAQIALAWLLTKHAYPIPKAVQSSHIDENIASLTIKLTTDNLKTLDKL